MIISEDRQSHLCHLITDTIWKDDLVDYTEEDRAVNVAKKGMAKFIQEFEAIDKKVKQIITSLKRGVVESSPEWDILYSKYFEQELQKSGKN